MPAFIESFSDLGAELRHDPLPCRQSTLKGRLIDERPLQGGLLLWGQPIFFRNGHRFDRWPIDKEMPSGPTFRRAGIRRTHGDSMPRGFTEHRRDGKGVLVFRN